MAIFYIVTTSQPVSNIMTISASGFQMVFLTRGQSSKTVQAKMLTFCTHCFHIVA